jgi:hypothetical protein
MTEAVMLGGLPILSVRSVELEVPWTVFLKTSCIKAVAAMSTAARADDGLKIVLLGLEGVDLNVRT